MTRDISNLKPDAQRRDREHISRSCAWLAMIMGATGLAGWIFDIETLKRIHPAFVSMKANTAICLMVAASCLYLLQDESVRGSRRRFAQAGAAFIGVVGLLTLGEHLFHFDLGIDQFLFHESAASAGRAFPGRMGPASAVNFMLLGLALLLLETRLAQFFTLLAVVMTLLIFLAYFYQVEITRPILFYLSIALHTVVAFVALCVGILFARPRGRILTEILGSSSGAIIARRMLPAALIVPALLGWFRVIGQRAGYFDLGLGAALYSISLMSIFAGLIWWTAKAINAGEAKRQLAEEALRESEASFHSMADNIAPLAWMANADGWIFFYNQRWLDYTGATAEATQGWGWGKVHHPDHIDRVTKKWNTHLQKGEAWEDTFPLRGKDGTYRWFLSRAFPIRDGSGKITRWFGTNTDVTDLREAQEALQRAQDELKRHASKLEQTVIERTGELRETVGELEAFSYSVAHDLRAPLRAMQGFSSILEEEIGESASPQTKDYLRRMAGSANRLDALIQDVLNYSKVLQRDLKLEPIDARKLMHEIIESYPNLHGTNSEIRVEGPIPPVLANPAALTQVISNLLGNAVKFVAPEIEPHVRIWAEETAGEVRISFEDNGIGIPKEAQERIFLMFQQFNPSGKYQGTGIGLAIVRKAVERMGGKVGVESKPGAGSRFWIELKRPAEHEATPLAARAALTTMGTTTRAT